MAGRENYASSAAYVTGSNLGLCSLTQWKLPVLYEDGDR